MVDVPIKVKLQVDANDLKNQLQNIGGGIVKSATGTSSGGTANIADKGNRMISSSLKKLGNVFQKALGDISQLVGVAMHIFNAVSTIIGALSLTLAEIIVIAGILVAILAAVAILGIIGKGIMGGFSSLFKVIDVMVSLISKMVEPFVNLLLPLMIPVLIALGFMAKLINMALRPLFALMMKVFGGGFGQNLGMLLGEYLSGQINLGEFLGGLKDLFISSISQVIASEEFADAMEFVNSLIKQVAEILYSFLTLDFTDLETMLAGVLGSDLAAAATAAIKAFHFLVSAIVGFVSQMLGGAGGFDKLFGEGKFEEVKTTNEGFGLGVDIAGALQALWDTIFSNVIPMLTGWVAMFMENPVETLWTTINDTVTLFTESLIPTIQSWIEGTLTAIITAMQEFLDDVWNAEPDGLKSSTKTLAEAMAWMANTIKNLDIEDIIEDVIEDIFGGSESKSGGGGFNDFISRPGMGVATFSPSDTIIGTKNPEALLGGGGNSVSVTVNVSGGANMSPMQFERAVREAVEDAMSNASRNGNFQKGW